MREIPRPRGVRQIVAAARGLTGDPCPTLDRLSAELGPTFAVPIGPVRMVVVGDPEHLTELFAAPVDSFRWGHALNVLRFYVGDGSVIIADGEEHRRRRSMVQPAFARRRLEQWAPMIVRETDATIDNDLASPREPIDLFPIGRRLVLRVVTTALFDRGLPADAATFERLIEPAKIYLEQSAMRQLPHPLPATRRARCRDARQEIDGIIDAEIARRRGDVIPDNGDVLDMLLADRDPATAPSDAEIRDQVVTLIAAGYDTTASALAWTLLAAASRPDVWERLRTEADTVFAGDVGPRTQPALVYARAVVHESLRLYPPGVFGPRQAATDVTIGPYVIPKGSMILWSPYLAGRNARTWSDPLAFRPERHLDISDEQAMAMRAAWVPFGRGARQCVGFGLAEMELVLMLARLAQRIDVDLVREGMPKPYGMVVNRPTGGVLASVRVSQPSAGAPR
ncbi:MAG TPA: cytochrome P450 [Acidimicrobiia bacterium]|jgi:cytochrome P450|nr:cytochrome P450 [Acidimicrobiia bacterium]